MNIIEYTVVLLSIVIIALVSFQYGYLYCKWKDRARVSKPKQPKEVPEKQLREILSSRAINLTSGTTIISPTQLNETRNFVKDLTSEEE